jgi:hypothetical protein
MPFGTTGTNIDRYKILRVDKDLSHLDAKPEYIRCVQESRNNNESRKYCHLNKWYKVKKGEDRPRCPHWGKTLLYRTTINKLLFINYCHHHYFFKD